MAKIKVLEIGKMTAVKGNKDRDDLDVGKRCLSVPNLAMTSLKLMPANFDFKFFAEVIHFNENFDNFIGSKRRLFVLNSTLKYNKIRLLIDSSTYLSTILTNLLFLSRTHVNYDTNKLRKNRRINLTWLIELYNAYSDKAHLFAPERVNGESAFDLSKGTDQLRKQIVAGVTEAEIRKSWEPGLQKLKQYAKSTFYTRIDERVNTYPFCSWYKHP